MECTLVWERHKYECLALKDRNEDLKPQRCKGDDDCTNWPKFRTKNECYFDDYSQSYIPYFEDTRGKNIVHHVIRNTILTK